MPRPADDTYWSPPLSVPSPIIAFLTKQKIFGAGGQVPTKRWLPYLTYDDPPMWQGAPLNSRAINVTTTQVKFFGQPGQVPTKRWLPYLTYDDPPMWQGSPLNSQAITVTRTQVKVFGQPGQAPPFRANFTYDDPPMWQGSPTGAYPLNRIPLRPFTLFTPYIWSQDYDDPPMWRATIERNLSLLFPTHNPFSNRVWQWSDDASGWTGSPANSAAIPLLTQQKVYGAGGQVPPYRWNATYDDPPSWQPWMQRNLNVLSVAPAPFSNRQWQWSDDAAGWQGAPLSSAVISPLTAFILYVPAPAPWMDEDDAPPWRPQPQRNLGLLAPTAAPFVNRQTYWYSEDSGWQGSPVKSPVITFLTQQKVFGAGGQVPPYRWNYTLDDPPPWQWPLYERNPNVLIPSAEPFNNYKTYWYSEDSFWQGSPLSSRAINVTTTQVKIFGQPGQSPPFRPNFTYDDASTWQWPLYERNRNVLAPSANPFSNRPWQWSDDASGWQGYPLPSVTITLTSFQLYKPGVAFPAPPDDHSIWATVPRGSGILQLPATTTFYGQAGQVPPFRPNFTYDDPPPWQWPLYERNANVLQPSGEPFNNYKWQWSDDPPQWQGTPLKAATLGLPQLSPFSNRETYWYSEDAWWNAKPVRSAAITLLTQQQVFGQGGQVVPFRWNYTIDDPPMWPGPVPRGSGTMQLPVTGRVLNLYAPFNWTYTFDEPPMWQGVPASFNYLLTQPNPPAKPSGNDWIDFRRRARRR